MQDVVGGVHWHEVGIRLLTDQEPVKEQHQINSSAKHQVVAGLQCGPGQDKSGYSEKQVHDIVQDRDLEDSEQASLGFMAGEFHVTVVRRYAGNEAKNADDQEHDAYREGGSLDRGPGDPIPSGATRHQTSLKRKLTRPVSGWRWSGRPDEATASFVP